MDCANPSWQTKKTDEGSQAWGWELPSTATQHHLSMVAHSLLISEAVYVIIMPCCWHCAEESDSTGRVASGYCFKIQLSSGFFTAQKKEQSPGSKAACQTRVLESPALGSSPDEAS